MLYQNQRQYGYTLIELLVVMAIMSTLLSVGVYTFRLANAKRNLDQSVETIREQVELVKNETAAPNQEITDEAQLTTSNTESMHNGFRLIFTVGNRQLDIQRTYQTGNDADGLPIIEKKEEWNVKLPAGVIIDQICYKDTTDCLSSLTTDDKTGGIQFRYNNNQVTFGQTYLIKQADSYLSSVTKLILIVKSTVIDQTRTIEFYPLTGTLVAS